MWLCMTELECGVGTSQAVFQSRGCLWELELCVEGTGGGETKMEVQGKKGQYWR